MAVGFGIIGCGMIANFHARAVADIRGASVVACYDTFPAAADRLAQSIGCRAYHDLPALLDDPRVDVVTICTPSGAHLEPAVAAAQAGKHVIVEKPLEITLARCDRIIAACAQAGVVLSTIFPSRFHESSRLLKQAIDQERFGRLTVGDAYVKWYRTQQYYDSGAWRGTWKLDGGGALMNQAIHSVDLLSWLMGPVKDLSARTAMLAHERIEVEDVAMAALRFANGALGVIEATTAAYPGALKRIEIHGSDRLGRIAGRGHHHLELRPPDPCRCRPAAADGREDQDGRRRCGSGRHRPPRTHRAIQRRAAGHQDGPPTAHRRPRRTPIGRDHPGHLQGGRVRTHRDAAALAAAEVRSAWEHMSTRSAQSCDDTDFQILRSESTGLTKFCAICAICATVQIRFDLSWRDILAQCGPRSRWARKSTSVYRPVSTHAGNIPCDSNRSWTGWFTSSFASSSASFRRCGSRRVRRWRGC